LIGNCIIDGVGQACVFMVGLVRLLGVVVVVDEIVVVGIVEIQFLERLGDGLESSFVWGSIKKGLLGPGVIWVDVVQ